MPMTTRLERIAAIKRPIYDYFNRFYKAAKADPEASDFTFGNPHEILPDLVTSLKTWAEPQNKDWFAYKVSEPEACAVVANSLRSWRGLPFQAEDIAMTSGGFGALASAIFMLVEPGDEVVYSLPPWFSYEPMVLAMGAEPVKVKVRAEDFDLDVSAIAAAITEKTRIVIVNTPNNPTGRIYPTTTLGALAEVLHEASERYGRRIYLLSDEPYSRLVFDGKPFHSPTAFYEDSLIAYSYGKVMLAPGQRIGWLAINPAASERDMLREVARYAQTSLGWLFPNALLQHAIADVDKISLDMAALTRKRDWMLSELRVMGYDVHTPEGTFYLLPRSPLADDLAFTERLAEEKVYVLPGTLCEIPGYFRISLTANEAMIERSLTGFKRAIDSVAAQKSA